MKVDSEHMALAVVDDVRRAERSGPGVPGRVRVARSLDGAAGPAWGRLQRFPRGGSVGALPQPRPLAGAASVVRRATRFPSGQTATR